MCLSPDWAETGCKAMLGIYRCCSQNNNWNSFFVVVCIRNSRRRHLVDISQMTISQGGSNEYPQSMFRSKNKKSFCYIKVGYKGVYITRT